MSSLSERLAALNREKGATSDDRRRTSFGEPSAPSAGRHLGRRAHGRAAGHRAAPRRTTGRRRRRAATAPAAASRSPLEPAARRPPATAPTRPRRAAQSSATARGDAAKDRFEDLKESVHSELLKQLGPQLYDANLEARPTSTTEVRAVLAERDELAGTGRSATRRPEAHHPGDRRRHPRLRPASSRSCATSTSPRSWSTAPTRICARAQRQAGPRSTPRSATRRTCAARSTRSSSRIGRRVDESSPMVDARLPDGSRVNAIVPPLAVDGSLADHPQVLRRPADRRRPDRVRHAERALRRLPRRLRARSAQRHRLRRHRRRQDHHAQRAVVVHPAPTSASSPSRTPPSSSSSRTTWSGSSRARPTSRARARSRSATWSSNSLRMRPDRIIVGEVRDASALDMLQAMNTGHDGSICTAPLQRPARHPGPPGDHGADGRHGPAGPRHPRAGGLRGRPDRAPDPVQGRHRAGSRSVTEVERMEGDIITLQDIFLYDHSAGFDAEGKVAGLPARPPACGRSSSRRWSTPTCTSTRGSSPRWSSGEPPGAARHSGGRLVAPALLVVAALGLPRTGVRRQRRDTTATIDHAQPTKGGVQPARLGPREHR